MNITHPDAQVLDGDRSMPRDDVARQILDELEEAGPWAMPIAAQSFNDDDIYIYNFDTKQLLREVGRKSLDAIQMQRGSFPVRAGETWADGRTAKFLGLWRPV